MLRVNYKKVTYKVEKGYALTNRTWKKRDKITIDFPMEVEKIMANNLKIKKVICRNRIFDTGEIVIATGSWSRAIAAMLNTKIPLVPGRGYSFTLDNSPYKLNHPAILTEGRVAITPMEGGNRMRGLSLGAGTRQTGQ